MKNNISENLCGCILMDLVTCPLLLITLTLYFFAKQGKSFFHITTGFLKNNKIKYTIHIFGRDTKIPLEYGRWLRFIPFAAQHKL